MDLVASFLVHRFDPLAGSSSATTVFRSRISG